MEVMKLKNSKDKTRIKSDFSKTLVDVFKREFKPYRPKFG
jgi:hypothetical protein